MVECRAKREYEVQSPREQSDRECKCKARSSRERSDRECERKARGSKVTESTCRNCSYPCIACVLRIRICIFFLSITTFVLLTYLCLNYICDNILFLLFLLQICYTFCITCQHIFLWQNDNQNIILCLCFR